MSRLGDLLLSLSPLSRSRSSSTPLPVVPALSIDSRRELLMAVEELLSPTPRDSISASAAAVVIGVCVLRYFASASAGKSSHTEYFLRVAGGSGNSKGTACSRTGNVSPSGSLAVDEILLFTSTSADAMFLAFCGALSSSASTSWSITATGIIDQSGG